MTPPIENLAPFLLEAAHLNASSCVCTKYVVVERGDSFAIEEISLLSRLIGRKPPGQPLQERVILAQMANFGRLSPTERETAKKALLVTCRHFDLPFPTDMFSYIAENIREERQPSPDPTSMSPTVSAVSPTVSVSEVFIRPILKRPPARAPQITHEILTEVAPVETHPRFYPPRHEPPRFESPSEEVARTLSFSAPPTSRDVLSRHLFISSPSSEALPAIRGDLTRTEKEAFVQELTPFLLGRLPAHLQDKIVLSPLLISTHFVEVFPPLTPETSISTINSRFQAWGDAFFSEELSESDIIALEIELLRIQTAILSRYASAKYDSPKPPRVKGLRRFTTASHRRRVSFGDSQELSVKIRTVTPVNPALRTLSVNTPVVKK